MIEHFSVNRTGGSTDLSGVENRLQSVLAIALLNNGGAGVQVDIQILGLAGGDGETAGGNLPGRNLQSRL